MAIAQINIDVSKLEETKDLIKKAYKSGRIDASLDYNRDAKELMIETLERIKKNPQFTDQEMHIIAAFDVAMKILDDVALNLTTKEGGCGNEILQ